MSFWRSSPATPVLRSKNVPGSAPRSNSSTQVSSSMQRITARSGSTGSGPCISTYGFFSLICPTLLTRPRPDERDALEDQRRQQQEDHEAEEVDARLRREAEAQRVGDLCEQDQRRAGVEQAGAPARHHAAHL